MGQSSVGSSPNPNQTQPKHKQKVIIAVVAVLVAHVGALWALANMPPMQLRPIEPTPPVKVKFVKIVEKPLPEPIKPKPKPKPEPKPEPKKEMPKPKKQVKIAEKTQEAPKKKEKVQQVKEKAPDKKVEMPPAETKVTTSTSVRETVKEQPKEVVQEQPKEIDTSPRNLGDAASVAWKSKPKPRLKAKDLEDVTNPMVVVRIDVDETGRIKARIKQSSGSPKVDKEVIRAVQAARFHPYKENGVAMPFYAEQPFQLQ